MEKIHPAVAATNVRAARGAIRCIAQRPFNLPSVLIGACRRASSLGHACGCRTTTAARWPCP